MVNAASDITPELLAHHGVSAVMVDLDDTLVASGSSELAVPLHEWLARLRRAGIQVLILSNGERARVRLFAEALGVEGLALSGKPFFWAFRRGLRRLGASAGATAMIGDQLFTDVLGANLAGLKSILVSPLTPGGLPHTRAARRLERLILQRAPLAEMGEPELQPRPDGFDRPAAKR